MASPKPNLGVSKPQKPRPDLSAMKDRLKEVAVPATHAEVPAEKAPRRRKSKVETQLIGVHLAPDVGWQLRMIAAEKNTDVKTLLIRAINLLFKEEGKPQIASDPIEK